jgi:hypothetical protein
MEKVGVLLNLDAAREAQKHQESLEAQHLAEYARAIGGDVTPEQVAHVLAAQGMTVRHFEVKLQAYADLPVAIRTFWAAWHSPTGRLAKLEEAKRNLPTVPPSLLDDGGSRKLGTLTDDLRRLAAGYDPAKHGGWWVIGPTRAGKSLALAHAALRMALEGRSDIHWTSASRLVEAKRGHRYGAGDCHEVQEAIRAGWLVIDEVGWEQGEPAAVLDVLAARYDLGRVTCATSGMTEEALMKRYGDAVVRRITESSRVKVGRVLNLHPRDAATQKA